jgi:hypothetical protein
MDAAHNSFNIGIYIIAVVIILAIVLIYLTYMNVNKLTSILAKKSIPVTREKQESQLTMNRHIENNSDEIAAAIALALYMSAKHANKSNHYKLIFNHVESNYSPWRSKVYGLRQVPVKIKSR